MYTDSHCHITTDSLYERIDEVLNNMKNVSSCMIMCTSEEEFLRALPIKEKDPKFKIAFGWFPGDAKEITEEHLQKLKTYIHEGKIDVLGEIGLDYYWDTSFNDIQKELFIKQILMANEAGIPIAIHMRESTQDCMDLLKQYAKTTIIMHCYSGSVETMKECIRRGYYISFAGPITFKNAKSGPDCVRECPLDRILSETDSPYLTPVPFRGKQNEPMYVEYTVKKMAEFKDMDADVLAKQIENNFLSIFEKKR